MSPTVSSSVPPYEKAHAIAPFGLNLACVGRLMGGEAMRLVYTCLCLHTSTHTHARNPTPLHTPTPTQHAPPTHPQRTTKMSVLVVTVFVSRFPPTVSAPDLKSPAT
jgi:hypothetical protein